MSGSALMGEPPNDEHDAQAIKRSWKLNHVNNKPTRKASIIPTIKPHNTPPDSRQTYLNACSIVIIFLTALITGTRLFLRIYQRDLRWGPDDWAILVGALGVVAFFGLTIAMAVLGGRRKHMYDVTYAEFNVFFVVGPPFLSARKNTVSIGYCQRIAKLMSHAVTHRKTKPLLPCPRHYQDLNNSFQPTTYWFYIPPLDDMPQHFPRPPCRVHRFIHLRQFFPLLPTHSRQEPSDHCTEGRTPRIYQCRQRSAGLQLDSQRYGFHVTHRASNHSISYANESFQKGSLRSLVLYRVAFLYWFSHEASHSKGASSGSYV